MAGEREQRGWTLRRHEGGVVIALGDRCQTTQHLSPLLTAVVAAPYFTSGGRPEEGERFAPVLQTHCFKSRPESVREPMLHRLPGASSIAAPGNAGTSIMLLKPGTR